jgi:class 3 adenylate cyclase
MGLLDYSIF